MNLRAWVVASSTGSMAFLGMAVQALLMGPEHWPSEKWIEIVLVTVLPATLAAASVAWIRAGRLVDALTSGELDARGTALDLTIRTVVASIFATAVSWSVASIVRQPDWAALGESAFQGAVFSSICMVGAAGPLFLLQWSACAVLEHWIKARHSAGGPR